MKEIIEVRNLNKTFSFPVKDESANFLKNIVSPKQKTVTAVKNISFSIQQGESVAFIGPNGAGKSTTIKMLTGILYPSSGEITVANLSPQKDRRKLSYKIGTVFGQRSQLVFNLPVLDSFTLFGSMYDLTKQKIKSRSDELINLFDLSSFINQPVRKLSLGQRMRAEIAASLIHEPEIIFLDEPTIGLDVIAKKSLRETLKHLNRETNTTIFLTSHDAGDIESITDRTIIINDGKIAIDETTDFIKRRVLTQKIINLKLKFPNNNLEIPGAELVKHKNLGAKYQVDTTKNELNTVIKEIANRFELEDLDVENPSLETIIGKLFEDEKKQELE